MLSSTLSRRIKKMQMTIVAETTALAGSTTESLRNIELVKSLGLAQQEIARLNATTDRILKLELKKVRYLRSLSFVQGTAVNVLRTSILFLMLYLIYTQAITVGQFFSLFIYSFFIFGPLQELGNVINIYRETEASLARFQKILDTPLEPQAGDHPVAGRGSARRSTFDGVGFTHLTASAPALTDVTFQVAARRDHRLRRPVGRGKDDAREAAGRSVPAAERADSVQRAPARLGGPRRPARADRIRHAGDAAVLRVDPRESAVRQAGRHRRGVPGRSARRLPARACWRGRTAGSTR